MRAVDARSTWIPSTALSRTRFGLGAWSSVAEYTDVHRRTTEYENSVLLVAFDRVVNDAGEAVVRHLEPAVRGIPDGVAIQDRCCASVNRNAEGATGHREPLYRNLAAEHLHGVGCPASGG